MICGIVLVTWAGAVKTGDNHFVLSGWRRAQAVITLHRRWHEKCRQASTRVGSASFYTQQGEGRVFSCILSLAR